MTWEEYGTYHDEEVPWPGPDADVEVLREFFIRIRAAVGPLLQTFRTITDDIQKMHGNYRASIHASKPLNTDPIVARGTDGRVYRVRSNGQLYWETDAGGYHLLCDVGVIPTDIESVEPKQPRKLPPRKTNHGPRQKTQFSRSGKQRW